MHILGPLELSLLTGETEKHKINIRIYYVKEIQQDNGIECVWDVMAILHR